MQLTSGVWQSCASPMKKNAMHVSAWSAIHLISRVCRLFFSFWWRTSERNFAYNRFDLAIDTIQMEASMKKKTFCDDVSIFIFFS